ncbi:two component transcriptional regulator, LytTR family [Pedobacter antarcticus]|nr:LytTR family DNA-binding domain-containing protein [Pedobacter antarcticus]SFF04226.1 two component transcriptional regulator, LytTR family [Pedobacter antarcticus]
MMQNLNCLIVDDEPIARKILVDYCSYLPILNIVGVCGSAFEARDILLNQKVDVVFLDINMPVLDGISFLVTIKKPPRIIFTTAYKKYAATAFDLAASDYLVKPFSLERFIQAVDRVSIPVDNSHNSAATNDEFILIKTENKIYNVIKGDIFYLEAKGNYTHLVFEDNILKPKMALSSLEKLLPEGQFLRVHRSFIINRTRINHIEGNRIFMRNFEIPIGYSFKESFMMTLNIKDN